MYLNIFVAKKTKFRKLMCHSVSDSYTEWHLSINFETSYECGSYPMNVTGYNLYTPTKKAGATVYTSSGNAIRLFVRPQF